MPTFNPFNAPGGFTSSYADAMSQAEQGRKAYPVWGLKDFGVKDTAGNVIDSGYIFGDQLQKMGIDPNTGVGPDGKGQFENLGSGAAVNNPQKGGDGGLFGLGPIVGIAAALAGTAFGIPPILTNMVTTAMSGGDPMGALLSPQGLMSVASFGMDAGGGSLGSTPGADVAGSEFGAPPDSGGGLLNSPGATPSPMQLADAGNIGNTMTDVSSGFGDAPKLDASDASASTGSSQPGGLLNSSINDAAGPGKTFDAFGSPIANADAATTQASQMAGSTAANQGAGMTAEGAPATSGPASSGPTGSGLLDSTMDWAKKNPQLAAPLAAAGITTAGSMLKGVGDRANAKEMLERKIAGEKELLDKKTQNTMELAEWQRRFGQAGALSAPLTGASSNPSQVLRRPDGSPVYGQNGLLFSN